MLVHSSDSEFVDLCYERLLSRPADAESKQRIIEALGAGTSRFDVVVSIAQSAEHYALLTRKIFGDVKLPDLTAIRPESYASVSDVDSPEPLLTFNVRSAADYDWLEAMIVEHGYYEKPGVWSFVIDDDKRVTSEIVRYFNPMRSLELGCATGPVIKLLRDAGIDAQGLEISHLAVASAYADIRGYIHFGDLLQVELAQTYDVIIGMDVFEHLNPNKLARYLARCYELVNPGGFLFTNIPAFGVDAVFGEVFPLYLPEWHGNGRDARQFSQIHVDALGWPMNGHLTWATARWWQARFEHVGFERSMEIEAALHEIYDRFYLDVAPARRSFFVFSKAATASRAGEIVQRIRAHGLTS